MKHCPTYNKGLGQWSANGDRTAGVSSRSHICQKPRILANAAMGEKTVAARLRIRYLLTSLFHRNSTVYSRFVGREG